MGLFGFYDMAGTDEQRKVANDTIDDVVIDTCAVTDSDQPYETGVQSERYNGGDWVIVEMYDTKELAEQGHARWVETFKKGKPESLADVGTCEIAKLLRELS